MPRLKIYTTEGSNETYDLDKDEVVIGRMPICDINIGRDKQDVSRKHARLTRSEDTWFIEDLHSRNHTYVNGELLEPGHRRRLHHGDRSRICGFELVFQGEGKEIPESGSVYISDSPLAEARSSISLSHSDVTDDRARLWLLMEVAHSLRNILSLDAVLEETLASLLKIFPNASRGVVGFIEGNEFIPKWWKLRDPQVDQEISVSRTVMKRVVQQREAILYGNIAKELPDNASILSMSIRSLMCAPLMDADNEVFGVFQIDSESMHGFDHDDLVLMGSVAIQASLAINFTRLHERAMKQKVIEKDLELARDVQSEFLPKAPPTVTGYEFSDYYKPARFIGGDYFDYIRLRNGQIALVVADVGGKGAPAALYMARMAMETRACLGESVDPAEVITQLNQRLSTRFATFVICFLDPETHKVTVVNAGHRSPILRHRKGKLEALGESITNMPFGVDPNLSFDSMTYKIQPGESVSIFSDGFEDAYHEGSDEYFGIERIRKSIGRDDKSAKVLVSDLVHEVDQFVADNIQLDDMCIVSMKRLQ